MGAWSFLEQLKHFLKIPWISNQLARRNQNKLVFEITDFRDFTDRNSSIRISCGLERKKLLKYSMMFVGRFLTTTDLPEVGKVMIFKVILLERPLQLCKYRPKANFNTVLVFKYPKCLPIFIKKHLFRA